MKNKNFRGAFMNKISCRGHYRTVRTSSNKMKKFTSTITASTNKNKPKSTNLSTPLSISLSWTRFSHKILSTSVNPMTNLWENNKSRTLWTSKWMSTNLSRWLSAIPDHKKWVTAFLARCLIRRQRAMGNTTRNRTISICRDKWLSRGKIRKSCNTWIKGSTCTTSTKST